MPTRIRDRDTLGEADFDAARAEGRALSSDRALEYALEEPATRDDAAAPAAPARLTRRELEVLRPVAQGMSNGEVAHALVISEHTVNGRNDVNQEEDCSTNAVVPVSAGTHKVELELIGAGSNTSSNDRVLPAIYIPFGGTGASPSSAAISSAREKTPESR